MHMCELAPFGFVYVFIGENYSTCLLAYAPVCALVGLRVYSQVLCRLSSIRRGTIYIYICMYIYIYEYMHKFYLIYTYIGV